MIIRAWHAQIAGDIISFMFDSNEDTVTLKFSRSQFFAVTILIVFLFGFGMGYVLRGRRVAPVAQSVPVQAELTGAENSSSVDDAAAANEVVQEELSIGEQIEAIERYEIVIDENDPSFGPVDAAVTIIEFSDFECPFCLRHFETTLPQLLEAYEGQIRYVFKDLPLTSIHPNAFPAAIAAHCAFEQDAFWPFHDLLFGGGLGLSRGSYENYASQLDLNMDDFVTCIDEERYTDVIQADMDYARQIGANSTPTFFINGIGVVGSQPYEVFAQIIDYELSIAAE